MKILSALCLAFLVSLPIACTGNDDGAKGTVLITGANRGLGLEYATQYAEKGFHVIGTARSPDEADELRALGAEVHALDVTSQTSVDALANALDGRPIEILINNAGYFNREDTTLETASAEIFLRTMDINAAGPLRVTQALIPNLEAGKTKTVISMSSQLGSIERSSGQWYAYRASKTALNQINKIWSEEFANDGFIFVVVHPGWVKTDMGGPNATYTPEQSVAGLIGVIDGLTSEDNGAFYDLNGDTIPW